MSSNSKHLTTNLKISALIETSTKIYLLKKPSCWRVFWHGLRLLLIFIHQTSTPSSPLSLRSRPPPWMIPSEIKTKQKKKKKAKGSERCFLPPRRRSSLCDEQSGPLPPQTDEADTTLAQIVFSCRLSSLHSPSSPLLSPRFRLVLTLMLTKRFVKQDLSGGRRRVEDEKTDKSERKERRGGTAGLRSTPGQFHGVWSVRFAFRHAALTSAWECYREPRWHLVTWGNSNYRNLLFIFQLSNSSQHWEQWAVEVCLHI